jgi:hypothetical protein
MAVFGIGFGREASSAAGKAVVMPKNAHIKREMIP